MRAPSLVIHSREAGLRRRRFVRERSPGDDAAPVVGQRLDGLPQQRAVADNAHQVRRQAQQRVVVSAVGDAARGGAVGVADDVVGAGGGRDGLQRLRVDLEEVVALHGVDDDQLPVGLPHVLVPLAGPVVQARHARLGDDLLEMGEPLRQRGNVGVHRGEDEAVPLLGPVPGKAVSGPVDVGAGGVGDAQEAAVVGIGPGVVRTLEPLGVAGPVHDQRAAVGAHVRQRSELAALVAQHDQRLSRKLDRDVVARLGDLVGGADPYPVVVPDVGEIGLQRGGPVGRRRQRPSGVHRIETRHDMNRNYAPRRARFGPGTSGVSPPTRSLPHNRRTRWPAADHTARFRRGGLLVGLCRRSGGWCRGRLRICGRTLRCCL